MYGKFAPSSTHRQRSWSRDRADATRPGGGDVALSHRVEVWSWARADGSRRTVNISHPATTGLQEGETVDKQIALIVVTQGLEALCLSTVYVLECQIRCEAEPRLCGDLGRPEGKNRSPTSSSGCLSADVLQIGTRRRIRRISGNSYQTSAARTSATLACARTLVTRANGCSRLPPPTTPT